VHVLKNKVCVEKAREAARRLRQDALDLREMVALGQVAVADAEQLANSFDALARHCDAMVPAEPPPAMSRKREKR
jgi:hypothetical protein